MAKRILVVGIKKNGKRWELTVAGAGKEILEDLKQYVGVMAHNHGATIMGSNPLEKEPEEPQGGLAV